MFILQNGNMFVDHADYGAIDDDLAKFFNQIEDKARFARTIGMEESTVRIKTSERECLFYLTIEDAIAIVEGGIERINCTAGFAARPREFSRDD